MMKSKFCMEGKQDRTLRGYGEMKQQSDQETVSNK